MNKSMSSKADHLTSEDIHLNLHRRSEHPTEKHAASVLPERVKSASLNAVCQLFSPGTSSFSEFSGFVGESRVDLS